jgi:3-oxoadipate CoA-transferase beta subunit
MMEHFTRDGQCKLVERCSYPLTGLACVTRVYTDLAVVDVTANGFALIETFDGLSRSELEARSGLSFVA